jgi:hypothetical protein
MRETLGYNRNHKKREVNDFYATPVEEVYNILQYEKIKGTILEPCCGMGHMVKGILKHNPNAKIKATDLVDYGYGETGLDFLNKNYPYTKDVDNIIINPPFKLIEEFVNKSIKIANKKVVLFARNQFVESQSRYENIFSQNPPTRIYQYVDRVACAKGGNFNKKMSSNMAFSWFVWDKTNNNNETIFKWIRRMDKK